MPNIKIGSKTFENVEKINVPLADGTGQASFGTGGAPEHIEWHQCPEAVRKFISEVTYDPDDYSASHIAEYAPASPLVSNYKPIGKTVGNKTFYNEVPNIETPYQTDGNYGTVKPLDQVRYINTPSAPNVRDLGGWACDGGTVKYGLLYRGGYLSKTDRDVLVGECGIRHDLDLRGTAEANITKSPLGDDVHYTCATTYNWYNLTNKDVWKQNLRCVFDAVTHNEPLYFHCAAGADRTGTLACVLEGLLGVSQSDIDKDYELTSFYSGTSTDAQARRRNESEWTGLISAVNAYTGDSFRDKCIHFVAQLGFTADEINAYRKAMIDGEPDEVTPNIAIYNVSNTLSNVMSSNDAATATEYQSYEADITVPFGYAIEGIKVTMGGKDVTAQAFSGTTTNVKRSVNVTATNCTVYGKKAVISGQDYVAEVVAENGYTVDAVTIMMGGVDVSTYYSDGKIAIRNVNGDIEIIATAIKSATSYDNLADPTSGDWMENNRIKSDGTIIAYEGNVVTNKIKCEKGDVIRVYGIDVTNANVPGTIIGLYNDDAFTLFYTGLGSEAGEGLYFVRDDVVKNNRGVYEWIVGRKNNGDYTSLVPKYVRISGKLLVDEADVIITINENIE